MSGDQAGGRPELGYEQARAELTEVVQRLEAGGTTLEESLELWQRGEELARVCQDWLDGARVRLQQAIADDTDDGSDGSDGSGGGDRTGGEAPARTGEGAPPF